MGRPKKIQTETQAIEKPVETVAAPAVEKEIETVVEEKPVEIVNVKVEEPVIDETVEEPVAEETGEDACEETSVNPVVTPVEPEPVFAAPAKAKEDTGIELAVSLDQYPKHPKVEHVYFATETFKPF